MENLYKQKELDKIYKELDKYPINKIISLDEIKNYSAIRDKNIVVINPGKMDFYFVLII